MKTKSFIILLCMIVIVCFVGCEEKNDPANDIQITVCGEKNPSWLLMKISAIQSKTSNYRPVRVSVYKEDSLEIIAVEDGVNSNASKALMFFDCAGNQISFNSDKYKEYFKFFKNDKFTLLWSN